MTSHDASLGSIHRCNYHWKLGNCVLFYVSWSSLSDSDIATSKLLPQVLPQTGKVPGALKFTDRAIKNLKTKNARYELWEGNGFGIRVTPGGTKSWVFVYHHAGRSRR